MIFQLANESITHKAGQIGELAQAEIFLFEWTSWKAKPIW